MKNFEVQLASVPDKEKLVAEIWLEGDLVCELNTEGESLEIEFFKDFAGKFDFASFLEKLEEAKSKLL